jgi:hypothetical protein
MHTTPEHNQKVARLTFASVYPHYIAKLERKGRSVQELHQVIYWLTGFDENDIQEVINEKLSFEQFFQRATLNPLAHLIKGTICGYKIEEIDNALTQKVRYLDKLVDELAKGKTMEKVLRVSS